MSCKVSGLTSFRFPYAFKQESSPLYSLFKAHMWMKNVYSLFQSQIKTEPLGAKVFCVPGEGPHVKGQKEPASQWALDVLLPMLVLWLPPRHCVKVSVPTASLVKKGKGEWGWMNKKLPLLGEWILGLSVCSSTFFKCFYYEFLLWGGGLTKSQVSENLGLLHFIFFQPKHLSYKYFWYVLRFTHMCS